ncbi:MAG TPA: PA2169 family four-helix-bundle protein, partial [Gemmataceae bacterium]|nr:PA2169 family four-helix-bundle protein [Gemmataceae bacterium]
KEVDAKLVALLDNLIETCKDGQNGYRAAAEKAQSKEMKRFFRYNAGQRARFAAELQEEVHRHGVMPPKGGTVAGALHRGWLNVKSALLGVEEPDLLAECERGEEAVVKNYEAASHEVLPPGLQTLIANQYKAMKRTRDRVHARREAATVEPAGQGPTKVSSP